MKSKKVALGLCLSALISIPVFAVTHAGQAGHGRAPNNQHPIGTAVTTDDSGSNVYFDAWTNFAHSWLLTFGANSSNKNTRDVGLRIDAPSGQRARSFSADIDTSNGGGNPYLLVFAVPPGATSPIAVNNGDINFSSPTPGLTIGPVHGGFQHVTYNPAADSTLANKPFPVNGSFASIYVGDYSTGAWSDRIKNVTVNNVPMTPNVQPTLEYDSTLGF